MSQFNKARKRVPDADALATLWKYLCSFGPGDEANLIAIFRELASMDLGDGIVFDPDSAKADAIREDTTYGGTRITLLDDLLWPPTVLAANGSQATATWRPEALRRV